MSQDPEINALNNVYETLRGLNQTQIQRIIKWVTDKFGLGEEKPVVRTVQPTTPVTTEIPLPAAPEPRETVQPVSEPVKKRRDIQPKTVDLKGFQKYDTIEDLFFASNARTITAKILLVAAYLHEKHDFKEFSSFDINSRLKKVGQGIQYINIPINMLLEKDPPLLIQTGRIGNSLKAKRKFKISEEGLRIARRYINE